MLGTVHNLWVVGAMGIWRGGINFHPKHLWGASNFNWYSVYWGYLKLTLSENDMLPSIPHANACCVWSEFVCDNVHILNKEFQFGISLK